MGLSDEIRIARQKAFFSQEAFAQELHVAVSTVNRWETGKSKPNLTAMKAMKAFCDEHEVPYSSIEKEWLENNNNSEREN